MSTTRIMWLTAVGLSLSACNQYWERTDTTTFGAGDSVAINQAMMVPNPWPPGSRDTRIVTDGAHAQLAVARYRAGKVTPVKSGGGGGGGGEADMAPTIGTQ